MSRAIVVTIGDRSACCAVAVNDIAARVTKEERKKIRASGEKKVKSRWKLAKGRKRSRYLYLAKWRRFATRTCEKKRRKKKGQLS